MKTLLAIIVLVSLTTLNASAQRYPGETKRVSFKPVSPGYDFSESSSNQSSTIVYAPVIVNDGGNTSESNYFSSSGNGGSVVVTGYSSNGVQQSLSVQSSGNANVQYYYSNGVQIIRSSVGGVNTSVINSNNSSNNNGSNRNYNYIQ